MSSGGDDDLSSSSSLRAQQYGLIRSLQNGQQQQGNRTGKMDNNLSAHHHLLYPHPSNHTLIHGTRNVHHTGNVNPHHHHTLTKNVHNNKMLYNDDPSPAYHHYEEPSTGSTTTGSGGNNGGLSDEPATASTCLVSRTQSESEKDSHSTSWSSTTLLPTACLVRTQSGTRPLFTTEMDSLGLSNVAGYGNGYPSPGDALLNSSVIRPGMGTGGGIITSRTVGTNKSRNPLMSSGLSGDGHIGHRLPSSTSPVGKSYFPSSSTGSSDNNFNGVWGRWRESRKLLTSPWKVTSGVLFVTCVTLLFCLVYAISLSSSNIGSHNGPLSSNTECSCPVMSEDSSSSPLSKHNKILPLSPQQCPVLCSGRGQYLKGKCICPEGWKGKECEVPVTECESANCSGHGTCLRGVCHCLPGWSGDNCDQQVNHSPTCPVLCSGRGQYFQGSCLCQEGWKGKECHLREDECDPPDCSGHGVCQRGTCLCSPGWKGEGCQEEVPPIPSLEDQDCLPDPSCGGNGVCWEGRCRCHLGWKGVNCSIRVSDGHLRSMTTCDERCINGRCTNGSCVCHHGFYGRYCSLVGCPNSCGAGMDRGECVKTADDHADGSDDGQGNDQSSYACRCKQGWTGRDCSVAIESSCTDGIDNDSDGLVDCADSDCCESQVCQSTPFCLTSPEPMDILLRKPPPPPTASFFQRMRFLIEEGSVQSYAHANDFSESFTSKFIPSRASVIRGQVVSPTTGTGVMGVRVGVSSEPTLGFVVTREGGWFDIMVNGGSAVVLQFQREPYRIAERVYTVPWNEIVVVEPVVMTLSSSSEHSQPVHSPYLTTVIPSTASFLDSSIRTQVCPEHDYDSMKPSLHANWKNYPCSSNGQKGSSGVLLSDGKILSDSLPIPGMDGLSLIYNSSRAIGYKSIIEMILTPEKVPATLKMIHIRVTVEGTVTSRTFEAEPSLHYTFSWNRRNAYRQKVYGVANVVVSIGYEYDNCPSVIWETSSLQLPGHDMTISEIGGWNLNIHHRYNFHEGILHKGDGSNIYLKKRPKVMSNLMGDGEQRSVNCDQSGGAGGCDGPAKNQRLSAPMALASGPDGSVYVGDFNLIRRIDSVTGHVRTIVELTQVAYKYHIAVGPVDGKLYISDPERHQVLRVINNVNPEDPSKNTEVLVGQTGVKCLPGDRHSCGDGRPAREAKLSYPKGIVVTLNGEIIIADGTNIRVVDKSGVIHTIIGDHDHKTGVWKPFPCSGAGTLGGSLPLAKVNLRWPTELAINPLDNSLYIMDDHLILKVTHDKRVKIVAGRPAHCSPTSLPIGHEDSSGQATSTFLETPQSMAFSPFGLLYVAESDSSSSVNRVRVINPTTGKIARFAGAASVAGETKDSGNGGMDNALALNSRLSSISSIAVTPSGEVIVADQGNLRIRAVRPFLPLPSKTGDYEIISQDTMEIYVFNKHGLHTATKSVLSGRFLFNFSYVDNTSFGKLSSVTNAVSGSRVQLLRDYTNQVKEVETSSGSKCRLEMSRTKLLESFILPDEGPSSPGAKIHYTYNGQTGLIKTRSNNTSGVTFTYEYDRDGRLVKAIGPDGEDVKCSPPP